MWAQADFCSHHHFNDSVSCFFFVQGGLVNNIERRVLEAQDYVEQAKDNFPKCKKFKKTSKRVRCKMQLTHYLSFFLPSFLLLSLLPCLPPSHSPIIPPLSPHLLSICIHLLLLLLLLLLPPHLAPTSCVPPLQLTSPRGKW